MKKIITLLSFCMFLTFVNAQAVESAEFKNRAIKFEFFSPLYGSLNFDYEQYLVKNINLDAGFGIIGIGTNEMAQYNKGVHFHAGPRLYFSPDYFTDDTKRYSDFQGWYFRPELQFSFFHYDYDDNVGSIEEGDNASMGVLLNLGRQYAIANVVSLEFWGGLGYNVDFSEDSKEMPFKFGYTGFSGGFPMALSFGFNVGVLTK